jgi:hypothetical protein
MLSQCGNNVNYKLCTAYEKQIKQDRAMFKKYNIKPEEWAVSRSGGMAAK